MRAGLESLDRFAVWREDGARMIEACQSPVWDTCLADHRARRRRPARRPPAAGQGRRLDARRADRPARRLVGASAPNSPPGGWAFEFHNDNYPDIDDTAEVVLALRRVRHHDPERVDKAIGRGVRWTLGMQSKNGAWGAFDADNTSPFPNRLPFCDFGEVIDPPSADVTAHVVEMLAVEGLARRPAHPARHRLAARRTGAERRLVRPLGRQLRLRHRLGGARADRRRAARRAPGDPPGRGLAGERAERGRRLGRGPALLPRRREWSGRGASTASQTAWALLALLAAGERDTKAVERGVAWLAATQRADGSWDEPYFTGTGFPWDFSINYHLYRQVFPLTALGRYVNGEPPS